MAESTVSTPSSDSHKDNKSIIEDAPPVKATAYDAGLRQAAYDGRYEDVANSLRLGANVDAADSNGETALHFAARRGHQRIVSLLLEHHADVAIEDSDHWRPLYGAVRNEYAGIVQILLDHGADINAKEENDWTVLHCAAAYGFVEVLNLLLGRSEPQANREAGNEASETPIHLAAKNGHVTAVDILLADSKNPKAYMNATDKDGWTPLFGACRYGRTQVIKTLLEHKPPADVEVTTTDGDRSLNVASREGHEDAVRQLLEYKEVQDRIDLTDGDGWTALCCTSGKGHVRIIQLLVGKGANVNATTIRSGETALHLAVRIGHQNVVNQLLEYPEVVAGIDITDGDGQSALYTATRLERRESVRKLLQNGADVSLQSREEGETALHVASREGYLSILQLLLQRESGFHVKDKRGWTFLHTAAECGYKEPVELILEKHADMLSAQTNSGETPVHLAARRGHEQVVITMIERLRMDVRELNPPVTAGWTALHWAAYYAHTSVVYWLLVNGASTKKKDDAGKTAAKLVEEQRLRTVGPFRAVGLSIDIEPRGPSVDGQSVVNEATNTAGDRPKAPREKEQTRRTDQKVVESKRKKPLTEDESHTLILDLLQNPPIVRGRSGSDEPYDLPSLSEHEEDACKQFDATIVDFYERGDNIEFLRRSRKVYDVIYNMGPDEIMKNAKRDLESVLPKVDNGPVEGSNSRDDEMKTLRKDCKFRWIHLPANNMEWMTDLVKRVSKDKDADNKEDYLELTQFIRDSMYELPGRASRSRFMKPVCKKETTDQRLVLCMPYLTFAAQTSTPCSRTKWYEKLLEVYEGKTIHGSQTLDQFFYHDLSDRDATSLNTRDSDQVVTRYIEQKGPIGNNWTILRVDQLWLWQIDEETIITSSTHRVDQEEDPVLERIYEYLKEEKGKGQGRPTPATVEEMSKFITNFCIGFIDQYTTKVKHSNSYKSAKEMFAISVNKLAVEEAELFRRFVTEIDKKIPHMRAAHQPRALARDGASEVDSGVEKEHRLGYKSISVAAHLLEEVKDIRDELSILRSVLRHQKTVWDDLFEKDDGGVDKNDRQRSPDYTIEEILEMDRSATRIQDSVKALLDLDQNEANISEAQQTTQQGRTLMFFTIVTIVFLPMSFLASLFALDVTSFPHDANNTDNLRYTPEWIFPIIFGVSAVISLPLIIFAFKANTAMNLLQSLRKWRTKLKYSKASSTASQALSPKILPSSLSRGDRSSSSSREWIELERGDRTVAGLKEK